MVRFSRRVQAAREGLGKVIDAHLYRPEELERLADRIAQLEDLLPLQSYTVALPFEGDLRASEIFNSDATLLAPRLLSWYGEPAVEGAESWVFLYGSGFSTMETKVIAGGATVADPDLISRNVMRIAIPATARAVDTGLCDDDGSPIRVIDVHVASPNGISNHLHVQVARNSAPLARAQVVVPGLGFKLDPSPTTVAIDARLSMPIADLTDDLKLAILGEDKIPIAPTKAVALAPPSIEVVFVAPSKKAGLALPQLVLIVPLDEESGQYTIRGELLGEFAARLIALLYDDGRFADGALVSEITIDRIFVRPGGDDGPTLRVSPGQLKVSFVWQVVAKPVPPPPATQGAPSAAAPAAAKPAVAALPPLPAAPAPADPAVSRAADRRPAVAPPPSPTGPLGRGLRRIRGRSR